MPEHRNKLCYGVTGTREPSEEAKDLVREWVQDLPEESTIYHGGCVGVDAVAADFGRRYGHRVIAVLPATTTLVCPKAQSRSCFVIHTPPGTGNTNDYRARNELLVHQLLMEGGLLKAFWNGDPRSGTKMTINIAERAGVPVDIGEIS